MGRRGEISVVVALLILLAIAFVVHRQKQRQLQSYQSVQVHYAFEEVEGIVAQKRATGKNVGEISPGLADVIAADPDFVIVCLVIMEARRWPGISAEEEKMILSDAAISSSEAVNHLQKLIDDRVKERMIQGGHDPAKECRLNWDNNNPATSLLFIDFPVAKKLGKRRQFVTRELEGYREGAKEWHEPEITRQQYIAWKSGGKWPFAEKPFAEN